MINVDLEKLDNVHTATLFSKIKLEEDTFDFSNDLLKSKGATKDIIKYCLQQTESIFFKLDILFDYTAKRIDKVRVDYENADNQAANKNASIGK